MAFTKTWDESVPAGTRAISLGDDDIRELKYAIRERLAIDHNFKEDETGDDYIGYHLKCAFIEDDDLGTGAEGYPILGAQTAGGKAELVFTDEDDTDVQLTSGGAIYGNSIRMTNNTYFKAIDAAGTGTVDLIKANASDVAVIPDGSQLATSGAPTEDAGIANKAYVDLASRIVQVVYHQRQDQVTCSTAIPANNNSRTSAEGNLCLTKAITPTSNSNILKIEVMVNYGTSSYFPAMILMDSTTVLATSRGSYMGGGGPTSPAPITYYMTSPGTSEKTFNVNVGDSDGAGKLNTGTSINSYDNGKLISSLTITEIKG